MSPDLESSRVSCPTWQNQVPGWTENPAGLSISWTGSVLNRVVKREQGKQKPSVTRYRRLKTVQLTSTRIFLLFIFRRRPPETTRRRKNAVLVLEYFRGKVSNILACIVGVDPSS